MTKTVCEMDMSNRELCYFRLTETTTRPLLFPLEHSMKDVEEITEYQEDILDDLECVQDRITQKKNNRIDLTNSLDYIENQSRRNNIRIDGVMENSAET